MKVFVCRHETLEQAEEELMIMVKNGGKVRDVIIEHPVYGEISGSLMLTTPAD
jgi:transcriptional regulator of NAD metabolism